MSWHYQAILTTAPILNFNIPVLQVHEVYSDGLSYTEDGIKPDVLWEEDDEPDIATMHQELIGILERMLADLKKYPPLDKRGE